VMRDGGRATTGGRRGADARRIGVAVQIAFAVPLLVGASLLVRSQAHASAAATDEVKCATGATLQEPSLPFD